jgi:hypothetical protein
LVSKIGLSLPRPRQFLTLCLPFGSAAYQLAAPKVGGQACGSFDDIRYEFMPVDIKNSEQTTRRTPPTAEEQ